MNMKWTVLASMLLCGAVFMTALSFLAVSAMKLTSSEDRLPLDTIKNWREYLIQILPIMVSFMLMSVFSCWAVTRSKKAGLAFAVILLHCASLVLCIIYCDFVATELENSETSTQVLKNRTYEEIKKHNAAGGKKWVPEWLKQIQLESTSCCGIQGFEDWKEFWPETPELVPESCCRKKDNCETNLEKIEWPAIPTTYIKNDEGCSAAINEAAIKRITETLKFFIVLTCLIGFTICGLLVQYIKEFFCKKNKKAKKNSDADQENADVDGTSNVKGIFAFRAWILRRFKRKKRGDSDNTGDDAEDTKKMADDLGLDPNNPLLNGTGDPNIDMNDQDTYSYTYLQQLKQNQDDDGGPLVQISNVQQPQVFSQGRRTDLSLVPLQQPMPSIQPMQPMMPQQKMFGKTMGSSLQQQQNPGKGNNSGGKGGNQPPTFTYEVIQNTRMDPFYIQQDNNLQNPNQELNSLDDPNGQGGVDSDRMPQPVSYPDDLEKQNLRQLLRFGRRHRRHRKSDVDPDS